MIHNEKFVTLDTTYHIFTQSWLPEKGNLKGCMVLVHGLGEHSSRYGDHFARFWTENGISIYAFDIPGFGKSNGKRGHIAQPEIIFHILDHLIDFIKQGNPNQAIILYGHSFGGELVLWYTLKRKPDIQCAIASAPGIGPKEEIPKFKLLSARLMNHFLPAFSMDHGLNTELLSKDKRVLQAYKKDPLVHRQVSARTGLMIMETGEWILEHAKDNTVKTLVMVGSEEGLVNPASIQRFSERAPHVDMRHWPGLYHELHNEPENQSVLDDAYRWVLHQIH